MVTTVKSNWVSSLNIDLGDTSQQDTYSRLLFGIKQLFTSASWTVALSSDSTQAGAADYWITAANVVSSNSTSGARSWIVLNAPSNFGGTGQTYSILIDAYSNSSYLNYRVATSSATFTGGSTIGVPTSSGQGGTTFRTLYTPYNQANDPAEQVYLNTWRNASNDVYWCVKRESTFTYARFVAVVDALNSRTNTARLLLLEDGQEPFHNPNIYGYATNNTSLLSATSTTRATSLSSWPSGVDSTSNVGYFPIFVMNNGNTSLTARDYGALDDLWAVPSATPDNATDATDSDLVRLLTIGSIALPTTFAQVPIL